MTLYSTLYRNCRLYPRFASLVAAAYILVGLIVALCVGIPTHSLGRGLYVAAVVLVLAAIADVIAYLVLVNFYSRLAMRLYQALDQFASVMEVNEVEDDDPDYDYDDDEDEGEGPVEGDDSDPEIVNAVTPLETITEPTAGTVPTAVADISNVLHGQGLSGQPSR